VIPKAHRIGSIGSPWWARIWRGDDRIRLDKIESLAESVFWSGVRRSLDLLPSEERLAVVFIHGFRVSFEGAAVRAAQIGFDLNVPGVVAFYSWPSLGTVPGYVADVETVEASAPFLAEFLQQLSRESGAERVHLVAHSMGNRGLLEALKTLFGGFANTRATMFDKLVLAAADVDARHVERYLGLYNKAARRTTLYASRRDRALAGAGLIRARYRRAGYIPPLTVLPGIDTIDVSPIDLSLLGHGYVFEAREVLTDMHNLVLNDLPPDRRSTLRRIDCPLHWRIRK
jgi:esterase/lipase superfamily enzyme